MPKVRFSPVVRWPSEGRAVVISIGGSPLSGSKNVEDNVKSDNLIQLTSCHVSNLNEVFFDVKFFANVCVRHFFPLCMSQ